MIIHLPKSSLSGTHARGVIQLTPEIRGVKPRRFSSNATRNSKMQAARKELGFPGSHGTLYATDIREPEENSIGSSPGTGRKKNEPNARFSRIHPWRVIMYSRPCIYIEDIDRSRYWDYSYTHLHLYCHIFSELEWDVCALDVDSLRE